MSPALHKAAPRQDRALHLAHGVREGIVRIPSLWGFDFARICALHRWMGIPVTHPADVGSCPYCALPVEESAGHARFRQWVSQ